MSNVYCQLMVKNKYIIGVAPGSFSLVSQYLGFCEGQLAELVDILGVCSTADAILQNLRSRLGLTQLRAVQVARLLRFADDRYAAFDFATFGYGSEAVCEA